MCKLLLFLLYEFRRISIFGLIVIIFHLFLILSTSDNRDDSGRSKSSSSVLACSTDGVGIRRKSSSNTDSSSIFRQLFVDSSSSSTTNDDGVIGGDTEDDLRWLRRYSSFPDGERSRMRDEARRMFEFGYDNYIKYAFPMDELDPIHCTGRGPDYDDPSNININDVLGDYSLTLIDSLSTLVVLGNTSEFRRAVKLVIEYVNFEKDNTVQVFEATIRVMGALLSAHLIIIDPDQRLGDFRVPDYDGELLRLAHDLASRLLPAFVGTKTGLPYPRVNLLRGVPQSTINETCTSGAGSLLLEFGVLSRLLGDPTFEGLARRANRALWASRDKDTGLFGNVIDIQTGEWVGQLSGLGAGLDSFYEYLLKAYILFGDIEDYHMFNESYSLIKSAHRRGRAHCNVGEGEHPMYVNVHMKDRTLANTWIDSLQASFPGVQILAGDVEEAICQHALYYSIWKKYGVLPERFNWHMKAPDISFYPLRPEFAESTYLLYMATKNPFYLHVGKEILENLNQHTKVVCGYATVHNVDDKSLEDRMESFFLSETCKYLYLLFDAENPVNKFADRILFTTEGHMIMIDARFRDWPSFRYVPSATSSSGKKRPATDRGRPWIRPATQAEEETALAASSTVNGGSTTTGAQSVDSSSIIVTNRTWNERKCDDAIPSFQRRFTLPLRRQYLEQLYEFMGLPTQDYLPPEPWDIL